jgi:acetyl esterase
MTEPFIRPDVRALLDAMKATSRPKLKDLDPAAGRQMLLAMRDLLDAPVGPLAVIRDVTIPGPAGSIPARLFDPREERAPGPMMMFFHGGGFVIGSIDTHAPACAEFARQLDMPVLSIDYRLAPEAVWPGAPDDCEAATRWAAAGPTELGRKITGLVLAGDSAGGTLTIVTALALRDAPAGVPVIAQWPIYPATDLQNRYASFKAFADGFGLDKESMRWFDLHYQPDYTHWRASPMQAADLAGLPPALVLTAGLDPLRDQGRAYAAALIKAGVPTAFREAEGNIHGFINMRRALPSTEADFKGALDALRLIIAENVQ